MTIRQLTDADWPLIKAFAERHFGFSHISLKLFNEHWFKPPCHDGWAALALDDDGGGLAGLIMFIVAPVWVEGQVSRMAFISSTATEAEARKKGGGTLLYLGAYRAFPLVGAQSGNAFSSPINAKLGNTIAVGMRRFLRLLTPAVTDICLPESREQVLAALETQTARHPDVAGLEWCWRDEPATDYDPLWQRFRARFAVTIDRTGAYLRHRYVDAPILRYRFLEIRRDGKLVGHAVARAQFTPAGEFYRITDFAAEAREEANTFAAIVAAITATGAIACDFLVVGTGLDHNLIAGGFDLADDCSGLDVVPNLLSPVDHRRWTNDFYLGGALTRQTEGWRDTDRIYFTKGDSDRDWPTGYDLERLGIADEEK